MFRKAFYYLSLYLGIVCFSFVLFHAIPSDPARTILGPNASEQQVTQLRLELGLEKPPAVQLANYIQKTVTLDFGKSFVDDRLVSREVLERLTLSLVLIAASTVFIFLYLFGVVLSSRFSWLKVLYVWSDFLLSSQPIFFSGIVVALLALYYYPVSTFSGAISSLSDFLYILPPALVTSMYPMAILSGILKRQLLEAQQSCHYVAARAMGFSDFTLLFKYAFKSCLIPLLAAYSNILPSLLTGAFIVEIIFSLPGIGSILLQSILMRDFPMLECTIIVNGAFFVAVNFIFEVLYPLLDPRIASSAEYESI